MKNEKCKMEIRHKGTKALRIRSFLCLGVLVANVFLAFSPTVMAADVPVDLGKAIQETRDNIEQTTLELNRMRAKVMSLIFLLERYLRLCRGTFHYGKFFVLLLRH